jgi:hypothetical protein
VKMSGCGGSYVALAVAYRELKKNAAEFAPFLKAGQYATSVRKSGGFHLKPFGIKLSKIKAIAKRRRELAMVALTNESTAVALDDPHGAASITAMRFLTDAGSSITERVRLAHKSVRGNLRRSREASVKDNDLVNQWTQLEGQARTNKLLTSMPFLNSVGVSFVPVPSSFTHRFEVGFPDDKLTAAGLQAMGSRCGGSNLQASFDKYIEKVNQPIRQADCTTQSARSEASTCEKFGTCIHTEPGKTLWKFRNTFLKQLKIMFPPGHTLSRKYLTTGFIVLEFEPQQDVSGVGVDGARAMESVYLHVSLMYLSPFRPTFQVVRVLEGAPAGEENPTINKKYIEAGFRC